MKRLIAIVMLSLSLIVAGYLVGVYINNPMPSEAIYQTIPPHEKQNYTVESVEPELSQTDIPDSHIIEPNNNDADIATQLKSQNDSDRMNALFFIWRTNLVNAFLDEVQTLAIEDENHQINTSVKTELPDSKQTGIVITNIDDPEEQLKSSLVENAYEYVQSDEELSEPKNLLDILYQLPEEK
jgi:hypothetical protein